VHHQHGFCFIRYRRCYRIRTQTQGLVDVGEHRYRSGQEDHLDVGDEGEGCDDDFVTGADSAGRQRRCYGRRAAGAHVGVLAAQAFGQFFLQGQRFPVAVTRAVEAIAHEHAGVEDILDLAALFISENFESWHANPR